MANASTTDIGLICQHLVDDPDGHDPYYQFTGAGTTFHLLCEICRRTPEDTAKQLRPVPQQVIYDLEIYAQDRLGDPQILVRPTSLRFDHQDIAMDIALPASVVSVQPMTTGVTGEWLALLSSGHIAAIDLGHTTYRILYHVAPQTLTIGENSRLILDRQERFVAIVTDGGQHGIVIDLIRSQVTVQLDRGDYYSNLTSFPAAFFEKDGQTYLVHGTAWNRLDISDPNTGMLLTERDTGGKNDKQRPDHYLGYFHSGLSISPSGRWIAEDGWVWSPFGRTRLWDLQQWFKNNVWESEDGDSLHYVNQRGYVWDTAMCWIDANTLAVWGFGNDDQWLIPAVVLYDASTGVRTQWFAGPRADWMTFDEYLYCISPNGVSVWDVSTGERLHHDDTFLPHSYHPGGRHFLTRLSDSSFRVSRLTGAE